MYIFVQKPDRMEKKKNWQNILRIDKNAFPVIFEAPFFFPNFQEEHTSKPH